MEGKLAQTMPAHILAASPTICKELSEKLCVWHMETGSFEEKAADTTIDATTSDQEFQDTNLCEPAYSLPLREVNVQINGQVTEAGVIDPGSQIIVIREDLVRKVGAGINTDRQLQMEGANGSTNWTLGCAEYLPLCVHGIPLNVHAHIVEHAPFQLLLGCPFQHTLLC